MHPHMELHRNQIRRARQLRFERLCARTCALTCPCVLGRTKRSFRHQVRICAPNQLRIGSALYLLCLKLSGFSSRQQRRIILQSLRPSSTNLRKASAVSRGTLERRSPLSPSPADCLEASSWSRRRLAASKSSAAAIICRCAVNVPAVQKTVCHDQPTAEASSTVCSIVCAVVPTGIFSRISSASLSRPASFAASPK